MAFSRLAELVQFFDIRAVGHTELMFKGLENLDKDGKTPKCAVVFLNSVEAKRAERRLDNRTIICLHAGDLNRMQGLYIPVIVDHCVWQSLYREMMQEVSKAVSGKEIEIAELKKQLKNNTKN